MKVSEITLQDLKKYFDEADRTINCSGIIIDRDGDEKLDLWTFDGVDEDYCLGSIYKVKENGNCYFLINGFDFPNGAEEEDFDENNCTIEEVVGGLLTLIKLDACESIDFFKNTIEQINTFGKNNNVQIDVCETGMGNVFE